MSRKYPNARAKAKGTKFIGQSTLFFLGMCVIGSEKS